MKSLVLFLAVCCLPFVVPQGEMKCEKTKDCPKKNCCVRALGGGTECRSYANHGQPCEKSVSNIHDTFCHCMEGYLCRPVLNANSNISICMTREEIEASKRVMPTMMMPKNISDLVNASNPAVPNLQPANKITTPSVSNLQLANQITTPSVPKIQPAPKTTTPPAVAPPKPSKGGGKCRRAKCGSKCQKGNQP